VGRGELRGEGLKGGLRRCMGTCFTVTTKEKWGIKKRKKGRKGPSEPGGVKTEVIPVSTVRAKKGMTRKSSEKKAGKGRRLRKVKPG